MRKSWIFFFSIKFNILSVLNLFIFQDFPDESIILRKMALNAAQAENLIHQN